ncbi:hypothetical protein JTE90_010498 [Oedothorax gibbosus]|uniref:CWH43-like N-terminal domain-containing protein n=1 Tax=Oedothorax gibbosus TaxID=931172 RepID=A0AAV6VYN1_9ARAC|nr:hypothetical protein JTE90_010498 [Oedothorax gibbosus]
MICSQRYMAKCSKLLLLTLGLQFLGIFIPYILVLKRNIFDPPLPFISQTTGFSPECGVFAFLLIPASFLGLILASIIHSVNNFDEIKNLKIVKQISSSFLHLYYFSWILICGTPITYTDLPNKYEWVVTVLILHMVGALLMLCSVIAFNISQGILSWNNEALEESNQYRKLLALFTGISAFIGIIALVQVGIEELSFTDGIYWKDTIYILPTRLSFAYIITTMCEWTLIVSNWLMLMTFYDQLARTELRLVIRRQPRKDH